MSPALTNSEQHHPLRRFSCKTRLPESPRPMFARISVIDCPPGGVHQARQSSPRKSPNRDVFFKFFSRFIDSLKMDEAERILENGLREISRLRPAELTVLCHESGKEEPPQILAAGREKANKSWELATENEPGEPAQALSGLISVNLDPGQEAPVPASKPQQLYRVASRRLANGNNERLTLYTSYRPDSEELEVLSCALQFLANRFMEARQWHSLQEMSRKDSLTGLYNRRYFDESLIRECERSHRYQRPLALIMMDLDHFKQINDTYGHPAGDRVLQECGRLLLATLRRSDIPCRYGGEELAVILPETSLEEAEQIARRLRQQLAQCRISIGGKESLHVTASLGVAGETGTDSASLLNAADQALYRAKKQGRNRVIAQPARALRSAV